jgi:hypothetical protein
MNSSSEIELSGIDGGNPLGFLAALGTFHTIGLAWAERSIRMSWRTSHGAWRPVLHGIGAEEIDAFVEALDVALKVMRNHPALTFASDLTIGTDILRGQAKQAQSAGSSRDRRHADFIAAYGSEATPRTERGMEENIQDTALRTMSGTGHQHFLGFMHELVETTEPNHLTTALFHEWHYTDSGPSLRWDPNDDRRYALRWGDPGNSSKSPIRTVRGANRLAIEALPLLPTAPVGKKLETTGFKQQRGEGVFWTWPIWVVALPLDPVRSILALSDLQAPKPDRLSLAARGIAEIFRCQRITVGKYRNFTPAYPT